MKKTAIALLFVLLLCSLAACSPAPEDLAGRVYLCEHDGFGGSFPILLGEDGEMQYSEGLLSSHAGIGEWSLDGSILTITEYDEHGCARTNRFRVKGDDLIFLSEGSDNFIYIRLEDGTTFSCASDESGS